ncbi:hypothetical protein ACM77A_32015, partial [Pseudomonas aeruginosa]
VGISSATAHHSNTQGGYRGTTLKVKAIKHTATLPYSLDSLIIEFEGVRQIDRHDHGCRAVPTHCRAPVSADESSSSLLKQTCQRANPARLAGLINVSRTPPGNSSTLPRLGEIAINLKRCPGAADDWSGRQNARLYLYRYSV